MGLITSVLGSVVGVFLPDRPYWAVKLSTGKWACELDTRKDDRVPSGHRPFDWTLDLIDNGDIRKVRELWLFCPPNPGNPLGQTAHLTITEPGTVFQMKVGRVDAFGAWGRSMASQVIGQVTNKETGACECFLWDTELQALGTFQTSVNDFESWREGIPRQGQLSHAVLGFDLS